MTKKDYILIAAALKAARPIGDEDYIYTVCDVHCEAIADALGRDNPRFDRARFLAAAGVQS